MARISLDARFVRARFATCAKRMGWDTRYFNPDNTKGGRCNVGAYSLNEYRPGDGKVYYSIVWTINPEGGEKRVSDSLPAREILAWMDGVMYGAGK